MCDLAWATGRTEASYEHAARGKLAARLGETERSLTEAGRAVELAEPTDLVVRRADAYGALAEVLLLADRPSEAASAAETALALCEAKENVAAASHARRLLEAIRAEAKT
jgi:hypothetical protein